jgi:flagellar biosynthesis protein FlhA
VPLVDAKQRGDLLGRVRGVRRKLSQDLGFLVPAVHIRDNLELAPNAYRITLGGVPIGEGVIHPDRELALNPGRVFGPVQGIATRDPAFGMEAIWIEPGSRDHAQTLGYTVVDPGTVIATHLSALIQAHAHEILGHEEVQHLLNLVAKAAPKLVEDLVPKVLSLAAIVRVLQGLLAERVPIRNMRAILETLADNAPRSTDPAVLLSQVRIALGRQIVQDIAGPVSEVPVMSLDADLERLLTGALTSSTANPTLEPGLAEKLQQRLSESARRREVAGEPAVLLVPPALRAPLAGFVRSSVPGLQVLAWNEIPHNRKVRLVTTVGR